MKAILITGALLALVGCASLSARQQAMNTDTTSLNTYATIGKLVDAYEGAKCGAQYCDPKAEKLRAQAWADLQQEHQQYTSGNFAAALTAYRTLYGLVSVVKGL